MVCIPALAAALTAVEPARAQYAPPPAAASVLQGISFSTATNVGDPFRARFSECDVHDTCGGKKLQYGCSQDRNRNTVLLKLKGGTVFFDAKLGLDADGSPLSKRNPGVTDQSETSLRYPTAGKPSVDSDKVPYIVIPGGGFAAALGIKLGDIAAVVYSDQVVYALVADQGPTCKLGEGSIELHERLKHKVCLARNDAHECTRLHDAGIESDVLYFIFPGSKAQIYTGLTADNVNDRLTTQGAKLFAALKAR